MEKEILIISTLHISSGSYTFEVYSDKTGEVEIFGNRVPVKLNKNKIEIDTDLSAKQFGGAEERDYILNGELLKGNSEFNMFMDYISKANTESLRNQIIDQWMIHLDEADQDKLVNKLRERGIMFVPAENRQFYEV